MPESIYLGIFRSHLIYMNRYLLFFFTLLFYSTLSAQQIYECKDFGFKFVIIHTSERDSFYTVPLITYIKSGSPADMAGMVVGAEMLWIAGEAKAGYSKNLTGLEFLNQINSRQYDCCMILYTTSGWQQRGELYASLLSYTAEFPKANKAPVEGGPKLLGTCVGNCKEDIKTILYENGDVYTGPVVNKVYPDPEASGGKYVSFAESEKIKTDAEAKYLNALAEKKKQDETKAQLAKQKAEEDAAALKKYEDEQAAIVRKKLQADSIINSKSAAEIINMIAAAHPDKLICGVGLEIQKINENWFITAVDPYSPAWLEGLKAGDRITSVALNENYIYDMNKLQILEKLTGDADQMVQLKFVRPSDPGNEMRADMHCFKIYANMQTLAIPGCVSGDCKNGSGVFIDAKGNIYDGKFLNGRLNGTGLIIMPYDSMIIASEFLNGLKNGITTIYMGRSFIHRDASNFGYNGKRSFHCNFVNDIPNGYGSIGYNFEANYSVKYVNGIAQGKALRILNDHQYIYCEPAPDYTLINCLQYEGQPTDLSMVEPVVTSNQTQTTVFTDKTNYGTHSEPANIVQTLRAATEIAKSTSPGFEFHDGGALVFTAEPVFDREYVRIDVPVGKTLKVFFMMEDADMNRVKFIPNNLSYLYENTDGGALTGGSDNVGEGIWLQYYTVTNNYDKNGWVTIEIRTLPADKYYTRTMYYVWGISY